MTQHYSQQYKQRGENSGNRYLSLYLFDNNRMNISVPRRLPDRRIQLLFVSLFAILGVLIVVPPYRQITGSTTLPRIKTFLSVIILFAPAVFAGYRRYTPPVAFLTTYLYYILIVFGTGSYTMIPPFPNTLLERIISFLFVTVPTPFIVSLIGYGIGLATYFLRTYLISNGMNRFIS